MALSGQGKEWLVASYEPREFGVTNTNDIKWMSTKLTPMPWHTHDQRIRINNPEAKKILKSFICCSEFGVFQFRDQEQSTEWDQNELMRGHDVMITAPDELAQMLKAVDKGK